MGGRGSFPSHLAAASPEDELQPGAMDAINAANVSALQCRRFISISSSDRIESHTSMWVRLLTDRSAKNTTLTTVRRLEFTHNRVCPAPATPRTAGQGATHTASR